MRFLSPVTFPFLMSAIEPSSIKPPCSPKSFLSFNFARIALGIAPIPVWMQSPSFIKSATSCPILSASGSTLGALCRDRGSRDSTNKSTRSFGTNWLPSGAKKSRLISTTTFALLANTASQKSTFGPNRISPSRS